MTDRVQGSLWLRGTVGGMDVVLRWSHAALSAPVQTFARYYVADAPLDTRRPVTVNLTYEAPAEDAPGVPAFCFEGGIEGRRRPDGSVLLTTGGVVAVVADDDVWASVGRGVDHQAVARCLAAAMVVVARQRGHILVHAGAVSVDGRYLILMGPSGTGKSTLCHALVRSGWMLHSDDSLFLTATGGVLEFRPFRRCLQLKRGHPVYGRADGTHFATTAPFQTTALVSLARIPGPGSVLEPLSETEALQATLAASGGFAVLPGSAQMHLAALARLVRETPRYRLACGTDVLDAPERADRLLRAYIPTLQTAC